MQHVPYSDDCSYFSLITTINDFFVELASQKKVIPCGALGFLTISLQFKIFIETKKIYRIIASGIEYCFSNDLMNLTLLNIFCSQYDSG